MTSIDPRTCAPPEVPAWLNLEALVPAELRPRILRAGALAGTMLAAVAEVAEEVHAVCRAFEDVCAAADRNVEGLSELVEGLVGMDVVRSRVQVVAALAGHLDEVRLGGVEVHEDLVLEHIPGDVLEVLERMGARWFPSGAPVVGDELVRRYSCDACARQWTEDLTFVGGAADVRCPACGSADLSVVG